MGPRASSLRRAAGVNRSGNGLRARRVVGAIRTARHVATQHSDSAVIVAADEAILRWDALGGHVIVDAADPVVGEAADVSVGAVARPAAFVHDVRCAHGLAIRRAREWLVSISTARFTGIAIERRLPARRPEYRASSSESPISAAILARGAPCDASVLGCPRSS